MSQKSRRPAIGAQGTRSCRVNPLSGISESGLPNESRVQFLLGGTELLTFMGNRVRETGQHDVAVVLASFIVKTPVIE